jgi:rfaE bifunctional protein nucleotidyltransferase chain/domain
MSENQDLIKLGKKLSKLRFKNKKIGICHGVFDILHPGHISYFNEAKKKVDFLIVSLTTDRFIRKGPGRPFFNVKQRKKSLESLSCIDYVLESDFETAVEIINFVKPNFYIKGPDYKNINQDISKNLKKEILAVKKINGKFITTNSEVFSSSNVINSSFGVFDNIQMNYIKKIKKKYSLIDIENIFKKIKKISTLVVGETILDHYAFCEAMGKSGKEPSLTFKKGNENIFLGGAAVVANNLSSFCKKVDLISYIGEKKESLSFINKGRPKNCKYFFINKKKSPTIVKKRYVDPISNTKVFNVYNINDLELNKSQNRTLLRIVKNRLSKSDLTICLDYGHGLINQSISKYLSKNSILFLNAQINSTNAGFHPLDKHFLANCLIINETELRYELRNRDENIEKLIRTLSKKRKFEIIIVTRGNSGSVLYKTKTKELVFCPAFQKNYKDKVGAGDTFLYIFSIFYYVTKCEDLSLFMATISAGESIKFYANSMDFSDNFLLKTVNHILK